MQKLRPMQCLLGLALITTLVACHLPPPHSKTRSRSPDVAKYGNIWKKIRKNYKIENDLKQAEVKAQIDWYAAHPHFINQMAENSEPYLYYIYHEIEKRGLPAEIVFLPIIESEYDPFAYSKAGASGLWQFMPSTALGFGINQDWWVDGRRDVFASTKAALDYLEYLHTFFNGNWLLAIAAYDAGEGTVMNALNKNIKAGRETTFWALDLPQETHSYLPKLLALTEIIKHPRKYEIDLLPISNKPYFAEVETGSQLDLDAAATLAGISLEEIYDLNPSYNRWATHPEGPHHLLIPLQKVKTFKENLSSLPPEKRVQWKRYKVETGNTLKGIANKFKTKVAIIKQVNHLEGNIIRAGKTLLIPRSMNSLSPSVLASKKRYQTIQKIALAPKKIKYTVKSGDSLWSIAHKYHVSVKKIQSWNHLNGHAILHAGQKLKILKPRIINGPRKNPALAQNLEYVVKAGDTMSQIASRHHVKLTNLRSWNRKIKHDAIQPGQKIRIVV